MRRLVCHFVLGSVLWMSCGTESSQVLSGTVTYRERVALPLEAVLEVWLEKVRSDQSAEIVARASVRTDGQQVPLPFSLRYHGDPNEDQRPRHVLHARIRDAMGRELWTNATGDTLYLSGNEDRVEIFVRRKSASRQSEARTLVYECDGQEVVISLEVESATVFLPERTAMLSRVQAASGAKYQGDDVLFWSKGNDMVLEIDGQAAECVRQTQREPWEDAKLRGVDFRAVGNEPGWHLEIVRDGRMTLVLDYGTRSVVLPTPAPNVLDRKTTFAAETEATSMTVVIEPGPCADTMSGAEFDSKVSVTIDGRELSGCGQALH